MALAARPMHIPAGLGIDQATRKELLDVGKANVLNVNARSDYRGGLTNRLGFTSLARTRLDATTRSSGNRMGCHKQVNWTIDGTHLDSYSAGASVSTVHTRVPEASVSARPLSADATLQFGSAKCGSYIATATQRGVEVLVSVESTDGAVIRPPEIVFTSTTLLTDGQIAAYSTYFILLASDSTTHNVKAWYLDTTSAATITTGWVSIGNVATDKATSSRALAAQSLTASVAFAYVNSSGGASQATVKLMTIAGATGSATINTASATPDAIAVEGSALDTLWVAWNQTTTIRVCGFSPTNLSSVVATTASIGTVGTAPVYGQIHLASTTTGKGKLIVNDGNLLGVIIRGFQTSGGACATDGSQIAHYGVRIACRPHYHNARLYGLFSTTPTTSGSLALCDWTDALTPATRYMRPVGMTVPGLTYTLTNGYGSGALSMSATSFAYPALVQKSAAGYSVVLFTFDFGDRKRWRSVAHGGSLYFAGGVLSYFDGRRVSEACYLHSPATPSAADSGGGSGPTGTFRYVCVFSEMDDDGNWCQSGVSAPSAITGTITDNTVTVTAYPLDITARLLPGVSGASTPNIKRLRVEFYRSTSGGEAPYYYVGAADNDASGAVVLSDNTADATSNRLLYGTGNLPGTNGSGQDRRCAPYCQDVESYNGMLVVASSSTLWYSGQLVDGEGVWFNPAFTVPIEGDDDITAIRAQDGTLYVFKRRGIWAVAGEPPSDNGMAGGLGTPRRLAVDAGCVNPTSVVVTSVGIFFQSEGGRLMLLGRDGAVTPVGDSIQDTLASFPIVSSAVLDDRNGLVRFTLVSLEQAGYVAGNGRTAVFDLTLRDWISVDDVRGAGASESAQDAAMVYVDGYWRYGWLGTNGTVYYERLSSDAAAHLDGSNFVTLQYELPPWKLGLNQEQRIYEMVLLFERHSACGITVEVALDYGSYDAAYNKVWTESATSGQRQLPYRPPPNTTAVQLRVKHTAPVTNGTGKGCTFLGISADIAAKQGPTKGTTRLNPELRR